MWGWGDETPAEPANVHSYDYVPDGETPLRNLRDIPEGLTTLSRHGIV